MLQLLLLLFKDTMLWRSILFNGISLRLWKKTFVRRQSYIDHVLSFSYTDPTLKAIWDLIIYSPSGRRYYPINNCASSYILRPRTAGFFLFLGGSRYHTCKEINVPLSAADTRKKPAPSLQWEFDLFNISDGYMCVCVYWYRARHRGPKKTVRISRMGRKAKRPPFNGAFINLFFSFPFFHSKIYIHTEEKVCV